MGVSCSLRLRTVPQIRCRCCQHFNACLSHTYSVTQSTGPESTCQNRRSSATLKGRESTRYTAPRRQWSQGFEPKNSATITFSTDNVRSHDAKRAIMGGLQARNWTHFDIFGGVFHVDTLINVGILNVMLGICARFSHVLTGTVSSTLRCTS